MDIIKSIEQKYLFFAPKERDIAMFVLNNSKSIQSMTINELAEKTASSNGSITRFCKKVGCKNYADFKIKLTVANVSHSALENKSDTSNVLNEVNFYYTEVINRNIISINEKEILQLVSLIEQSQRIYVLGIGSSALTAIELHSRLIRMGKIAFSCTDSDSMQIASALVTQNNLFIVISNSGYNKSIESAVIEAQKNNAVVVSLTSFAESNLAKLSDFYLLVYNEKFLNKENFINSQFSLMYLVDTLSAYLLQNQDYSSSMQKTIKAIELNRGIKKNEK